MICVPIHFHNEYEIYFLTEGELPLFLNNRAYQVKKGSDPGGYKSDPYDTCSGG